MCAFYLFHKTNVTEYLLCIESSLSTGYTPVHMIDISPALVANTVKQGRQMVKSDTALIDGKF